MILELADRSQLDVNCIFGGPRLINGIKRDVLSFEIDPEYKTVEELKEIFSNSDKTNELFVYVETDGYPDGLKTLIGEGYNIMVSCSVQNRKIDNEPGYISPDEYEDIIIVNMAQLTYDEYQSFLNGNWTPPLVTG